MSIPTLVDEHTFTLIYEILEKLPKNADIVELGSFLGGSIAKIRNKLNELKRTDCSLMAIDNWECSNISNESKEWSGVKENFMKSF
jgi:hypothetical protein